MTRQVLIALALLQVVVLLAPSAEAGLADQLSLPDLGNPATDSWSQWSNTAPLSATPASPSINSVAGNHTPRSLMSFIDNQGAAHHILRARAKIVPLTSTRVRVEIQISKQSGSFGGPGILHVRTGYPIDPGFSKAHTAVFGGATTLSLSFELTEAEAQAQPNKYYYADFLPAGFVDAKDPGQNFYSSAVRVLYSTPTVATPVISPGLSSPTAPFTCSISCATSGATIRYTTNGTTPTASSSFYTGPFQVTSSTTVRARAFRSGFTDSAVASQTYTFPPQVVATPVIFPATGNQTAPFSCSITCATSGATIRYTLNGTTPTSSSTLYTGPFQITSSTTVRARAFRSGFTESAVAGQTYMLPPPVVATPVIAPSNASPTTPFSCSITCATSGAEIRYTLNGTSPTASSTLYSGPFLVSATTTVRARAFRTGMTESAIASRTYTFPTPTVATPVISPSLGNQSAPFTCLISCATSGAEIRYTTDGTTPTASSMLFGGGFQISASTTIKARAFRSGFTESAVATQPYTVTTPLTPGAPTISPAGGRFTGSTQVTIQAPTNAPAAELRYTLDGSDPTAASTLYFGPITISQSLEVRARAIQAGSSGPVASAVFQRDPATTLESLLIPTASAASPLALDLNLDHTFSTSPFSSTEGHAVEVQFDFGDGTTSAWSSSLQATHRWTVPGTYTVRARGRCATHTAVVSGDVDIQTVEVRALNVSDKRLPWMAGERLHVSQGNNSTPTHSGRLADAWDFNKGSGSQDFGLPVVAALPGVVLSVVDDQPDNGIGTWGNMVRIDYDGAQIGRYAHLMQYSVFVSPGERVRQGQVIGLIGNSGRSGSSHLHYQEEDASGQSISAPFGDVTTPPSGLPEENPGLDLESANDGVFQLLEHLTDPARVGSASPYTSPGDTRPRHGGIRWFFDDATPQSSPGRTNLYIQSRSGGSFTNVLFVYDALHGARRGVVLRDGFSGWWQAAGGPASDLSAPLTEEYLHEDASLGLVPRQDFVNHLGVVDRYLLFGPSGVEERIYTAPGKWAPGSGDPRVRSSLWHPRWSPLFVEAYRTAIELDVSIFGRSRMGEATDLGGGAGVHDFHGVWIQDFQGTSAANGGISSLILNERLAKVFRVSGAIRAELDILTPAVTGAPSSREYSPASSPSETWQDFENGTLQDDGSRVDWVAAGNGGSATPPPVASTASGGSGGGGGGGCTVGREPGTPDGTLLALLSLLVACRLRRS